MNEPGAIRISHHVPNPPSAVWSALTDPALLAKWWAPGDVQPVVGHRFTLQMGPFGEQQCEVIAVEPERLFAFRFGIGVLDTTITWLLEAEGDGTLLSLEHAGFDLGSALGGAAYRGMGAGWPGILQRIDAALAE